MSNNTAAAPGFWFGTLSGVGLVGGPVASRGPRNAEEFKIILQAMCNFFTHLDEKQIVGKFREFQKISYGNCDKSINLAYFSQDLKTIR